MLTIAHNFLFNFDGNKNISCKSAHIIKPIPWTRVLHRWPRREKERERVERMECVCAREVWCGRMEFSSIKTSCTEIFHIVYRELFPENFAVLLPGDNKVNGLKCLCTRVERVTQWFSVTSCRLQSFDVTHLLFVTYSIHLFFSLHFFPFKYPWREKTERRNARYFLCMV